MAPTLISRVNEIPPPVMVNKLNQTYFNTNSNYNPNTNTNSYNNFNEIAPVYGNNLNTPVPVTITNLRKKSNS